MFLYYVLQLLALRACCPSRQVSILTSENVHLSDVCVRPKWLLTTLTALFMLLWGATDSHAICSKLCLIMPAGMSSRYAQVLILYHIKHAFYLAINKHIQIDINTIRCTLTHSQLYASRVCVLYACCELKVCWPFQRFWLITCSSSVH